MIAFTKEQLSEVMCKHAEKENGLHDLLEIMLESLMVAERGEFLREQEDHNKGNGYRFGHTYGHGKKLEFRIPRDRFGNFHPKILAILRDQEEECEKLAGSLYTKGLTQAQVGQVFNEIYGEHYSKSSISRMIDFVRDEVSQWLARGLDAYYPIVFVDCVHIKVFRKKKAATEAFYVILGVTEDGTREVLGIYNSPVESAAGWGYMFDDLHERGVECIGLMVADGLSGLDKVIGEKFPGTAFQRCTTHLKRNMLARVRHGDKKELADDMREVFRTGDKNYTIEEGIRAWKDMCMKWGKAYLSIRRLVDNEDIGFYFTYLNYVPQIQSMIYTTNWIERLQKDFRRVTRMRGALPDESSVIVLMGRTAMDKESYHKVVPRIREDKEYCLIHYDASKLCGICLLRQYYLWDELILQLGEERIAYLFMLEPTENASYEKMAGALNERYFSRPVFLDQHGWFKNENGLNPRAGSLDILTDWNGKIILVGNLRNNHRFFYRIKRKIASKG